MLIWKHLHLFNNIYYVRAIFWKNYEFFQQKLQESRNHFREAQHLSGLLIMGAGLTTLLLHSYQSHDSVNTDTSKKGCQHLIFIILSLADAGLT